MDRQTVIEALSRSTVRRDSVGLKGTDEQLLRMLCSHCAQPEIEYFAAICTLLRLLDGLLSGRDTCEGITEKYFNRVRELRSRFGDLMRTEASILSRFDEAAQLFSRNPPAELPELIGENELKVRAADTYRQLKSRLLAAVDDQK